MSNKVLAAGSVALMGAGSLLGASAAQAATVADCGTYDGATVTLIDGNLCDVVFDVPGEYSFTAPAGVTALEAVLIGGGAGSVKDSVTDPASETPRFGYGGWVAHFEYADLTEDVDVIVGAGGTVTYIVDGETVTQGDGGENSYFGSDFAEGEDYTTQWNLDAYSGDPLSDPYEVGENNPLFPAIDGEPNLAFSGQIYENAGDCPNPAYGSGGSVCGTTYEEGADGAVVIRYNTPTADLASTGVDANSIGIAAGALGLGGVALAIVAAVRRARRTN